MPSSLNGTGVTFNDGTTQSTAATAGNYIMRTITSPQTWTKPSGLKAVKVTLVGAGGNGGSVTPNIYGFSAQGGSGAGGSIEYIPAPSIPGPVSVTVGSAPSKTSSFGAFLSATGGGNGAGPPNPTTSTPNALVNGGAGSGGDINVPGQPTGGLGSTHGAQGAFGLSQSSVQPQAPNSNGNAGIGFGGGAQGASGTLNASRSGGAGAPGIVIVEEFY
jgi:hypothetical protein